jgi:AcrR family transcriptional regulator
VTEVTGPTTDPRQRLLAATIDHVAAHGAADLSLRSLAAAIGTSHRMLIYHFGSKEGLLVEVVRELERRQRAVLTDLDVTAGTPAELARRMWRQLSDPALWPHERLFFDLCGQALRGRPGTAPLLDGLVDTWVALGTELSRAHGVPLETARAHARLGVAVMRGLILDLLATGDRAGADEAMEAFLATYPPSWTSL